MAQIFYDRVKETATVTGTSNPYALAGAETSYQAFGTVLANGATCFYCAVGRTSNSWETGLGTYTTSGDTLARTAVQESSNSNSAVNWGAETIDIFLTQTATSANNAPTNNTSASSDYAMAVGETAYVTYSGVTSIALHIATSGTQEYELVMQNNPTVTHGSDGGCNLNPNNTTFSGGQQLYFYNTTSAGSPTGGESTTATSFNLVIYGLPIRCVARISTGTVCKTVISDSMAVNSGGSPYDQYHVSTFWNDTATAWTSLGTVVFPFAQTGTIIVRRIF